MCWCWSREKFTSLVEVGYYWSSVWLAIQIQFASQCLYQKEYPRDCSAQFKIGKTPARCFPLRTVHQWKPPSFIAPSRVLLRLTNAFDWNILVLLSANLEQNKETQTLTRYRRNRPERQLNSVHSPFQKSFFNSRWDFVCVFLNDNGS